MFGRSIVSPVGAFTVTFEGERGRKRERDCVGLLKYMIVTVVVVAAIVTVVVAVVIILIVYTLSLLPRRRI